MNRDLVFTIRGLLRSFGMSPSHVCLCALGKRRTSSGGTSKACVFVTHGGQLPHHRAVVPHPAGNALPRQGGRVHGCLGLHRQQLHAVRDVDEQSFKNY